MSDFYEALQAEQTPAEAKRITDFIKWAEDSRGIDKDLSQAVIEQFTAESFLQYANDVSNHGIMGGYNGFTQYVDTEAFYVENRDAIIQWVKDYSESTGLYGSFLEMLVGTKVMQDQDFSLEDIAAFVYENDEDADNFTYFANAMSWIVGEEVCNAYSDFEHEYDEDEDEDEDDLDSDD